MRTKIAVLFVGLFAFEVVISCSTGGGLRTQTQAANAPTPQPVVTPESVDAPEPMPDISVPSHVLNVVCRGEWGARPPNGDYVRHEIKRITIHHQGTVFKSAKRAPARLKTMQHYHQGKKKGFIDISYHFVVDPDGNVYEGRPVFARGETRTDYDTTGHLLVCLLGDFDKQEPTDAQVDALADVSAWASGTFDVDTRLIAGHRDHAHTLCPGENLHRLLTDGTLRGRVDALLEAGGVRRGSDCAGMSGRLN